MTKTKQIKKMDWKYKKKMNLKLNFKKKKKSTRKE